MGIELPEPGRAPNGIRLEIVRDVDALQTHAEAWNRLVVESGQRPELSHAWILTHLETRLKPGDSWFCLLAYDQQKLVGVLPIVTVPRCWPGGNKCLRFETPYDIFNTGAVESLLRPGYAEDVFPLFLNYLWRIPCACCCLRFRGVPGARIPEIISRRLCRGSTSVTDQDGYESVLSVEGSRDEYFNSLAKNFHRNLRRINRRISEQPNVNYRFESGNAEVNAEQFIEIEHRGWKAKGKTSIRSNASHERFFRLLVKRMEEQGWLRWAFLELDGKPVAGQFMVQSGGVLYVVKIGYDEQFASLSPGAALFGHVIENALESPDIQVMNFLSGYPWMKNWNVQLLPVSNIAFFPDTPHRWGLCKQPMQLRAWINRMPRVRKAVDAFSDRLMNRCPQS